MFNTFHSKFDNTSDRNCQVKYLIFDCIMLESINCTHDSLDERLRKVRDEIMTPHAALLQRQNRKFETLPMVVELKTMHLSFNLETLFDHVLPNLPHDNDGIIFTPRNLPYRYGTNEVLYVGPAAPVPPRRS